MVHVFLSFLVLLLVQNSLATTEIRDLIFSHHTIRDLPCPSQDEYKEMIKEARINLNTFKDFKEPLPERCTQHVLPQLIKLLIYFKNISVQLPEAYETHEVLKKVKKPWNFFIKSYNRLELYYSSRAYAAFDINSKNLLITKIMFSDNSPVIAVATLLHEAAHGRVEDPGHAPCQRGNLKFTLGACDEVLEVKDKLSGAYTYEFWFLWMMSRFSEELDETDKLVCRTEAEQLIANRFNYVHQVAQFNDLVVVLDNKGQPLLLDPITKDTVDIGLQKNIVQESTKVLFKEERSQGVAFLSTTGKLTSWDAISGQKNEIDILPIDGFQGRIEKYLRGFNFKDEITRSLLITNTNEAFIESTNRQSVREYVLDEDLMKLGPVKYVEMLSNQQYLVLLESGQIVGYDDGKMIPLDYSLLPEKIVSIAPDVPGFKFYFIAGDGILYQGNFKKDYMMSTSVKVSGLDYKKDDFQTNNAMKYAEGIGYRALLSKEGNLKFKRHSVFSTSKGWSHFPETFYKSRSKYKDFVFIRTVQFDPEFDFEKTHSDFENKCGVKPVLFDPWMQRPMAVDKVSNLVVWDKNRCRIIARNVKSVRMEARSLGLNVVGLRESQMVIDFINGRQKVITGYD